MNTIRNWKCAICREAVRDDYMVDDGLWNYAGFDPCDVVHLACFEKQLGRKVTSSDLPFMPINEVLRELLGMQHGQIFLR